MTRKLENDIKQKEIKLREKDIELKNIHNGLELSNKKFEQLNKEYHKSLHDKLHKEISLMMELAQKHIERKSFEDVRHAYDTIREIYSKLSPEGKKKVHGDVMKLKEDILEKAFGSWTDTKESGVEYIKRMRKEWETREKRIRG